MSRFETYVCSPTSVGLPPPLMQLMHVRVLSKLGRRTGKGNRWGQSRVAYVRKQYAIDPHDDTTRDDGILNLAQASQHSGVSDTTLLKLIQADILVAEQIAPYAPLEVKRDDLDREPVLGILQHLKATGKLVLEGKR